ncbi:MAG TPA: DUF2726 domain-containing protein [Chloroflexi bacterium]|nr:DUF2726 domain-containing protein [Chloroflexota bacterium]
MQSRNKLSLLRSILRILGLSQEAVDDIVDWVLNLLSGNDTEAEGASYPYGLRDDFLSPAELNFYRVLVSVVSPETIIFTKVSLGDLFYAKTQDASAWRIYTNKIDRKHVDFLLCNAQTMQPRAGIELDDRSHLRTDRQYRDEFVNRVFEAAGLPLLRIPVQRGYAPNELRSLMERLLRPQNSAVDLMAAGAADAVAAAPDTVQRMKSLNSTSPAIKQENAAAAPTPQSLPGVPSFTASQPVQTNSLPPKCPKCGGGMVLRTARHGTNQGRKFWGCSNYPKCHGIVNCDSG